MGDLLRDHVAVHWVNLAKLLGMEGKPIKVWVDPDADWVHVITEWDERDGPPPPTFKRVAQGGWVEQRTFHIMKTWNP